MMKEFEEQLAFEPIVKRPLADTPNTIVVGGMGGSALAGDALAYLLPEKDVRVHRDYDVPVVESDALYVAVSYSGNTEEAVSFATSAMRQGKTLAVVASGGTLASFAEREGVPFVQLPGGGAPRYNEMYMTQALLALVHAEEVRKEFKRLSLDEAETRDCAQEDARFMLPSVPLLYTSHKSAVLGRIGKLLLNESARTPAFANVFPELNHNEMQAFAKDMPEGLEHLFRFVIIRDEHTDPRIERRMDLFSSLIEEQGKCVRTIELTGSRVKALTEVWIRFILASEMLAETRAIDPHSSSIIEQFKKLL